ncbi:MAG: hypothetical protein V7K77_08075 [Nostoc sp.]|uniref:hypothetical protein n=1 Tax=Nostoc sp. TaxID=1180 RepID=UPI002FF527BE
MLDYAKPPTTLATTRGSRKGAVAPQPTIFLQLNCVDTFAPVSLISNTPKPSGVGVLRS